MSAIRHPTAASSPSKAIGQTATAVAAAVAGWMAHAVALPEPVPPPASAQSAPAASRAAAPTMLSAPFIAVSGDGLVTLRVEQQPLHWVLEQIAHQAKWPELFQRVRPSAPPDRTTAAPAAPSPALRVVAAAPALALCSEAAAAQADPTQVLHSIEAGSEVQRFEGLMLARSAGLAVSESTLRTLYETGASERVQVAAFEAYLALRADKPDAIRAALQAGQYASSPHIQREASRRLAELQEVQRLNALPPLADP